MVSGCACGDESGRSLYGYVCMCCLVRRAVCMSRQGSPVLCHGPEAVSACFVRRVLVTVKRPQ